MRITFKVKPIKLEGRTKDEVIARIRERFGGCVQVGGTDGDYLKTSSGTKIVYTLQKFKRKTQQTRNKHDKYHDSKILRQTHWVMYAYVFEPGFPVILRQTLHTFTMNVKSKAASPYAVN